MIVLAVGTKRRCEKICCAAAGITDCSDAIQLAINVARCRPGGVEIHLPAGAYVVTKTLRVTDLAGGGISFIGEGGWHRRVGQAASWLRGRRLLHHRPHRR